jgi:Lipocalin-like domain
MKKIHLLAGTLLLAGVCFTACSDDDDSPNATTIEGTYKLKEVNTAEATDFDMDGDLHIDQTEESNCYDSGKIILNSDNTFTYVATGILIDEATGQAGCATPVTLSGTWEAEGTGTDAVLQLTYEDENGDQAVTFVTKQGTTLTWEDDDIFSVYPDRNDAGGAIYTAGSITYIFKK